MVEITIYHYLFLALCLFVTGICGLILSRNIIKMLISIEIMLTGINFNFITFSAFCDNIKIEGCLMALFYVGIGTVELAVALYIFYLMNKKKHSENIDNYGDL